jgi:MFS transporter, PHS family, inorganic phosphate transporter
MHDYLPPDLPTLAGQLSAAIVSIVAVTAYKNEISADSPTNPVHVDFLWRIIIGLGCVPATLALYFRLTIPETPRFTMDVERNVRQASQDVDTFLTTGTFVVDPDAIVQRANAPKATRRDFIA